MQPHEIDHLGHMNVRRYAERAEAGAEVLLGDLGLDDACLAARGSVLTVVDNYTRHYREQLLDTRLVLAGGPIEATPEHILCYCELRNAGTGELGATSLLRVVLRNAATRAPEPFPDDLCRNASERIVDWPEHGRPRSLGLAPIAPVSFELLEARGLVCRNERTVDVRECDVHGFCTSGPNTLAWGPELPAVDEPEDNGRHPLLHHGPEGERIGFATAESRRVLLEAPRAGATIRTLMANTMIARKTRIRREWTFDTSSGFLVAAGDFLDLAFDRDARRAVDIPDALRHELEEEYHPDIP